VNRVRPLLAEAGADAVTPTQPLPLLILIPFIAAFIAAAMPPGSRTRPAVVAGLGTLAALVLAALQFPRIDGGEVLDTRFTWLPEFGLDIVWRMDGLAWLFSDHHPRHRPAGGALRPLLHVAARPGARFFPYMLAFMGAMLGVVLSGNLIQLVLFWELTSVTVVPADRLLAPPQRCTARRAHGPHGHGRRRPVPAGRVLMLGHIVGSYELDDVLAAGDRVRATRCTCRRWCWSRWGR
jgi:multicomponent K+:H+ antiporter subunit A